MTLWAILNAKYQVHCQMTACNLPRDGARGKFRGGVDKKMPTRK